VDSRRGFRLSIGVRSAVWHPWLVARSVGLSELRRLIGTGAQLVDVLPEGEYREMHLPGAISLPLKHLDGRTAQVLDRRRAVVVYCWDSL
jgi:rhodanese-related sulfurtransferase